MTLIMVVAVQFIQVWIIVQIIISACTQYLCNWIDTGSASIIIELCYN